MRYIEKFEKDLYTYLPPLTKRPDFDDFWKNTLEITRKTPLNSKLELYDYPSRHVKVYSISYNGFDETRIHGWYIVPQFTEGQKLPCLINYHGYTDDRGMPADFMQWITMDMCVISVDCREQCGETGNTASYSHGSTQSVVCKGILDKNEYYYRAVYMDCVKAIDFACAQPEIDSDKIVIHGASQGGGLGTAVCALDERPFLAMLDVPSNSNIERRIEGSNGSFSNVTDYLKRFSHRTERVFETLSYFDTMNMSEKIKCRVLASVGLKDQVCPAIMFFASYNRIQSSKTIEIYPFNGHEGGGRVHNEKKLRFLKEYLFKENKA